MGSSATGLGSYDASSAHGIHAKRLDHCDLDYNITLAFPYPRSPNKGLVFVVRRMQADRKKPHQQKLKSTGTCLLFETSRFLLRQM